MNKKLKIIKLLAICFGIFLISTIFNGLSWIINIDNNNQSEKLDFQETYNQIEEIEIDVEVSAILIKKGTTLEVTANNINKTFTSKTKHNELKIKEKSNILNKKAGTITITIPENTNLKKLEISNGAGKINIKDITAKELDIEAGAGELKIESSIFNNLELSAGIGKVDLEVDIINNAEIESGIGELNLILLGEKEDYTIKASKGIGNIQINGENKESNTIYGTGNRRIELDGGIGNIKVSFQK